MKTDHFEREVEFHKNVLGLSASLERPDFVVFRLPAGDLVEIFGPNGPDAPGQFRTNKVAGGFLVDDIDDATEELRANGVELVGSIERNEEAGLAWVMFRGPDGELYELVSDRNHA